MLGVLGEVGEIDPVMRQHQNAAGPQSIGDIAGGAGHRQRRQIVDQLCHDRDIVAGAGQSGGDGQTDRARTPRTCSYRLGNQGRAARGRLGRVQSQRPGGDGRTVGSVTGSQFEQPAPRPRSHCMEDRASLQHLVAVVERPPGVGILRELSVEASEVDRLHRCASTKVSTGRLNAAICFRVIVNPPGSSVIRPV